jgi:hypothetical protein
MNFNDYAATVSKWRREANQLESQIDSLETQLNTCNDFLAYVHGAWKRLSQTAEDGNNDHFFMIVNTGNSRLFLQEGGGWNIERLVSELKACSFNVKCASPDPQTGMALGCKVIGPNYDGVYVLKFLLGDEKKSWADVVEELD